MENVQLLSALTMIIVPVSIALVILVRNKYRK